MITCTRLTDPTERDIAQLRELIHQLTKNGRTITLRDVQEVAAAHVLYVASDTELDGQIVGTALLAVMHTLSHVNGQVEDVVVADTHRGQGIGRALMGKLLEAARLHGVERIDLGSEPYRVAANLLYQSLGFALRDTNLYRLTL